MKRRLTTPVLLIVGLFFSAEVVAQPVPTEPDKIENPTPEPVVTEEVEPLPTLITQPADAGFGSYSAPNDSLFSETYSGGRVDRRQEVDVMADHAIIVPNAYIPKQHTFSFSNTDFFLNSISYSATDKLQLSINLTIPSGVTDLMIGGSAKIALVQEPNYLVSVQPFTNLHVGDDEIDVSHAGIGAGILADFYLTDNFVVSTGAHAFGSFWAAYDEFNYDNCESRTDFINGGCREVSGTTDLFPAGGHWLSIQASALYYMTENLSLRGELITGVAIGSFLGTEILNLPDETPNQRQERFTDPTVGFGIPNGSALTFGAGLGWSGTNFGVQVSGYVWRGETEQGGEDEWLLSPALGTTIAF